MASKPGKLLELLQQSERPLEDQTEHLQEIYQQRVKGWDAFFEKWAAHRTSDGEKEFCVDDDIEWKNLDELASSDDDDEDEQDEEVENEGEIPEYEKPEDEVEEVDESEQKSPTKEINEEEFASTVHKVQELVIIDSVVDDVVDDVKCQRCGKRTFLPIEYMENVGTSLCNNCAIIKSGHADCMEPECKACISLARELEFRLEISKRFSDGSLLIVRDQKQDKSLPLQPRLRPRNKENLSKSLVEPKSVQSPKKSTPKAKKKSTKPLEEEEYTIPSPKQFVRSPLKTPNRSIVPTKSATKVQKKSLSPIIGDEEFIIPSPRLTVKSPPKSPIKSGTPCKKRFVLRT